MFSKCSHDILNMFTFKFSMCSHNVLNVPNAFPTCSQCTSIYPIITYIGEPKGTSSILLFGECKFLFRVVSKVSEFFFVMGQLMMGNCQKNKKGKKKKKKRQVGMQPLTN
jgi:hypothetical protein